MFRFPHHTILEFCAALHAVNQIILPGKKTMTELVQERGVDGYLAHFWMFISSLVTTSDGRECLLSALSSEVHDDEGGTTGGSAEFSRRLLLLLHCDSECSTQSSQAVSTVMSRTGLHLTGSHLNARDCRAAVHALRQYSSVMKRVEFYNTTFEGTCVSNVIAAVSDCTRLDHLEIDDFSQGSEASTLVTSFNDILEKNRTTLRTLCLPLTDDSLLAVEQGLRECSQLIYMEIGSPLLTNASADQVANILEHHHGLKSVFLRSTMDDQGLSMFSPSLQRMACHLEQLEFFYSKFSIIQLCSLLPSLTSLKQFSLVDNPVSDQALPELLSTICSQCHGLQELALSGTGLTLQSIPVMAKFIRNKPSITQCYVLCKVALITSRDETVDQIIQSSGMKKMGRKSWEEKPYNLYGFDVIEHLCLQNDRKQELYVLVAV